MASWRGRTIVVYSLDFQNRRRFGCKLLSCSQQSYERRVSWVFTHVYRTIIILSGEGSEAAAVQQVDYIYWSGARMLLRISKLAGTTRGHR